jgi:hypothetical protein
MDGKAMNDIQSNISSNENSSRGISIRNYIQIYPKEFVQVKSVLFNGKGNLHKVNIESHSIV